MLSEAKHDVIHTPAQHQCVASVTVMLREAKHLII